MAGFISVGAITITNLNAPNVYVAVLLPTPQVAGVPTNVAAAVGTASWGPLNTPTVVGSPNAYKSNFGWIVPSPAPTGALAATANPYEMASAVAGIFNQASLAAGLAVQAVRVSDGSDTAATLALLDTTTTVAATLTVPSTSGGGDGILLTAVTPGSGGNAITFVQTVSGSGTTATVTVVSNAISVASNTGVTNTILAAALAASGPAAALVTASILNSSGSDDVTAFTLAHLAGGTSPLPSGTLTGLYTGSLGNGINATIALSAKTDGSSNNYFNVTISPPAGYGLNSEYYPNLKGTTTGSANSPFWVNLANALANGIPQVCGPSLLCTLATPSATDKNPAIITASLLTGGTDGVVTAATVLANAVGSAAANPYTGLFSLIGSTPKPAVAVIAGFGATAGGTDLTTYNPTIQTFIDSSACEFFCDFPLGTSTAAAITTVSTPASGGISDYNFCFLKDWAYWNDGVSGLRFSPMAPFAAGVRAVTQSWNSLLNLQVKGIIGTYRTVGSGKAPYSPTEVGLCNANGILLVTSPCPGGNYVGFNTGVNSSMQSNPATGPEEFASMTNFLAATYAGNFGPVIGQNQSNSPVDPLRKKVRDLTNTFCSGLQTQNPPAIDSFSVTCDKTNNPPASVKAHIMTMLVATEYLSSVWYFVVQLVGGNTVQVSVSQGS